MSTNQHIITLQEAETMTHAYQNASQFQDLTIAVCIDNDAYQQVLDQQGCISVRTYFGLDADGKLTIVVVGVDDQGEDMTSGILLNHGYKCPAKCPNNSSLIE
jgi:hypothetical protein|tara:strand:+ start:361 stop:669 length:309 start_codon:yes stop_codon:yes gene_type:complete